VTLARDLWKDTLALADQDPDRQDLLQEFASAYDDLQMTVVNLPPFDDLAGRLRSAILRTRVEEINARRGQTPKVDWQAYPYILIGGQAMDRGFTVEGLTVTYMPRTVGVGHADTVQQRARFFGYKKRYLGYCRVFLEASALEAYRRYVEHEEDVRARLLAHRDSGQGLADWKRAFFLTTGLKPTRANVLGLDYMRGDLSNEWFTPKAPHDSVEAVEANREVFALFRHMIGQRLRPNEGHPQRLETHKHLIASGVSLQEAQEHLLTQLRVTRPDDSSAYTGLLLQIQSHLEQNPGEQCDVYVIRPGQVTDRGTGDNDNNEISNLFQGAYPNEGPKIYPGDREMRDRARLTIQLHEIRVFKGTGRGRLGQLVIENVPTVAVWVPGSYSRGWLVQEQGGTAQA